ncbi:hypothetical protein LG003_17475 [Photorhabdus kleinii]|uniref:hypothetical protein n=1 Tax=Photorhabdus kleinii TaxID=768034 RepID=UPI0021D4BBD7|nr:hypothetical protein [Photorhabdus kleinii]MCT8344579.1 hypothetical protein [Photorhabdus kleinii]
MMFSARYPLQTKGFARNRKCEHVNNHWQAVIYLRGEVFYIDVEIAPYRQLGCTVQMGSNPPYPTWPTSFD